MPCRIIKSFGDVHMVIRGKQLCAIGQEVSMAALNASKKYAVKRIARLPNITIYRQRTRLFARNGTTKRMRNHPVTICPQATTLFGGFAVKVMNGNLVYILRNARKLVMP